SVLQRSSVSFRRQGSSGRIWDDLHIIDPKTGRPLSSPKPGRDNEAQIQNHETEEEEDLSECMIENQHPHMASPPNHGYRSPPENKDQRCGFSALFGRCLGSPTA
ncbi:hypothetical protein CFOL_v3_16574, partial [Cephalotus follicularis]